MKQVQLGTTGIQVSAVGQGTFKMGEDKSAFSKEVDALRYGIELGMTLLDTAEAYADGGSEKVVAKAIEDCRERVFVVSKVWPSHAEYNEVLKAAKRSVKRLGTAIDLYLLHWPSKDFPLEGTMLALKEAVRLGHIRHIGVSNFTPSLLAQAQQYLEGSILAANQFQYHLQHRNMENDVIPYCQEHNITMMAYSPFGERNFFLPETEAGALLHTIGAQYGKSPSQVAVNWILRHEYMITIPKAVGLNHVRANAEAAGWELSAEDCKAIDRVFPRPSDGMKLKEF